MRSDPALDRRPGGARLRFDRVRWRLAALNLAVLALVLGVTLGSSALGEARARDAAIEQELRLAAERAARRLEHGSEHDRHDDDDDDDDDDDHGERGERRDHDLRGGADDPPPPDRAGGVADRRGIVRDTWGTSRVRGLPQRADLGAALGGREVVVDHDLGGEPVRVLSLPVLHEGHVVGAVQVAKLVADERRSASRTLWILAATGGAGLLLAAAGSIFLAGRAMRPIAGAFDRQRRFIADASHELRTPVAVVRARAELLQREGSALAPAITEELALLRKDADELSALLGELLDLARLDAGEADLALEPVALADVVEEIVAQLEPLAAERGVALSAATAPVWGRANLARTRQVLRALAHNALKHTAAGGHVRLDLAPDGAWARLRVEDDGEGIAPEHLPRVFDRFYRADPSRGRDASDAGHGAGLGLSIAAELVRAMGGEIGIESTVGQGTTITVRLPLAPRGRQDGA